VFHFIEHFNGKSSQIFIIHMPLIYLLSSISLFNSLLSNAGALYSQALLSISLLLGYQWGLWGERRDFLSLALAIILTTAKDTYSCTILHSHWKWLLSAPPIPATKTPLRYQHQLAKILSVIRVLNKQREVQ
jgi:hypothetical protein